MPLRLCKIALAAASAFFLLLVVFNNLTDYDSNYQFVAHVLAMDTTFPGNAGMWRAIKTEPIYHLFYATIILWEAIACGVIAAGAWRLWQQRSASAATWQGAKSLAAVGLGVSMIQWYVAFLGVGGEWFLMWQSTTWNGQQAALRMFEVMGISLIFLLMRDEELDAPKPASR